MTRWGLILLIVFLVLGLRSIDERRAVRYVVTSTAVVLALIFAKGHAL